MTLTIGKLDPYGIGIEAGDAEHCAECQRDVPTVDESYRCQDCAERAEHEAIEAANEAEVPVSQAIICLEIAAVNFGMDMSTESLMALLRAHHSLARAQGYVLLEVGR